MTRNLTTLMEELKAIVLMNLQQARESLKLSQIVQTLGSKIITGSILLNDNSITCYMSLFPHDDQSADSIDTIFLLSPQPNMISIKADIAWSTGEMLAELMNLRLALSDQAEILEKVDFAVKIAQAQGNVYIMHLLNKIE